MTTYATRRRLNVNGGDIAYYVVMGFLGLIAAATVVAAGIAITFFIVNAINAPSAGTIHTKDYDPAHTSVVCHQIGKSTICTPVYVPDHYSFDLYGKEHKHGWVSVDAQAYNSHAVGDYYDTQAK